MGNFIWHDWARFVSIAASVYLVWASYWAIFYRKYFWDFVDGILRDPAGIQPSDNSAAFIAIIVKVPMLQIVVMFAAASTLLLELPAPFMKGTALHRSIVVRIVMLGLQAFMGLFLYQATNGAIYSLIAAFGYTMAQMKGETLEEKAQGGKAEA